MIPMQYSRLRMLYRNRNVWLSVKMFHLLINIINTLHWILKLTLWQMFQMWRNFAERTRWRPMRIIHGIYGNNNQTLTFAKSKYSGFVFSPPSLTGTRMMTALSSGRPEAGAGWLLCNGREAFDPSAELCPEAGALWLSMTSALYTVPRSMTRRSQTGHFVCVCVCAVRL